MTLVNARTEQPVALAIEVAGTRKARRRGLLGRDRLDADSALLLTPCNAVHTVGMRFAIDVVFVDARGRVRKLVHNLKPWRMAISPLSRATIELAAGALAGDGLRVGDRLYLAATPGEMGAIATTGARTLVTERRVVTATPA